MIEFLLRLAFLVLIGGAGIWVMDRISMRWTRQDMASDDPLVRTYAVQLGAVRAVARRIKLVICLLLGAVTIPLPFWGALAVAFAIVIITDLLIDRLYVRPRRRAITGDA